jgi:hypothetical protein
MKKCSKRLKTGRFHTRPKRPAETVNTALASVGAVLHCTPCSKADRAKSQDHDVASRIDLKRMTPANGFDGSDEVLPRTKA